MHKVMVWLTQLSLYILDMIAVPEIYETIMDLAKWNTRALSKRERLVAKSVFLDSIDLDMVRLDERAHLGPRFGNFAYVSYHTINSFQKLSNPILVHELMHVWQFTYMGSVYIINALLAQKSKHGYNYQGLQKMHEVIDAKQSIMAFNYEQQADIICDYYRIAEGRSAQWSEATLDDLDSYNYFLYQVQNPKFLNSYVV